MPKFDEKNEIKEQIEYVNNLDKNWSKRHDYDQPFRPELYMMP